LISHVPCAILHGTVGRNQPARVDREGTGVDDGSIAERRAAAEVALEPAGVSHQPGQLG
jgi:hypothetical protein